MSFNLDPTKQAHKVILTRKAKKVIIPQTSFNNKSVQQISSQKHTNLILGTTLIFDEIIKVISPEVNITVSLLRILNNRLPRFSLTTIFKSFGISHLDYGDAILDKAYSNSLHQRLESLQYQTSFLMTGAIKSSLTEKGF